MSAVVRQEVQKVHVVIRMHVCMSEWRVFKNNPLDINVGWSWRIDVGDHTAVRISRQERKNDQIYLFLIRKDFNTDEGEGDL